MKRLTLFGSATGPEFDPARSDLDFSVEYLEMPGGMKPDAYLGLAEDLERLFGRRVDLLDRKAARNPYLLAAIEREEILLYESA